MNYKFNQTTTSLVDTVDTIVNIAQQLISHPLDVYQGAHRIVISIEPITPADEDIENPENRI